MSKTICLLTLIACLPSVLLAQSYDSADSVTFKNSQVYAVQGEQQEAITNNVQFPHDVEISTNGTFKVGKAKARAFAEGQVLLRDGWLVSPDGSFQPVMDHVVMKDGRIVVVRDGQAEDLTRTLTFLNGTSVTPDGYYSYSDGRRTRLNNGEWFQLDGNPIPSRDAATLINGQVVLQKDGAQITLQPVQTIVMRDGARVSWDGSIQPASGPAYKLREGQTILIVGLNIQR